MEAGRRWPRTLAANAGLVVAYAAAALLALRLDPVSGIVGVIWPSSGIALAVVRLCGWRLLPGVFFGELVVMSWLTPAPLVVGGAALANTAEIALGVYVLRCACGRDLRFDALRHVVALIGVAVVTPLVSATISTASLVASHILPAALFGETARAWWIGNALGDIVVTPLLLAWVSCRRFGAPPFRVSEAVLTYGTVLGATGLVFFRGTAPVPFAVSYLHFPLLIWAAYRFRVPGAALATALVSLFAAWGTAHGSGPFTTGTLSHRVLSLQLFLGCVALSPLVLAGAVHDRARALQMREEFIAIASHELRTPLAALQIHLDALLRIARRNPENGLVDRLAKASGSARRLEQLVARLLDVSQLSSDQLVLEPEPTSLAAIVRDVVARLSSARPGAATPVVLNVEQDVIGLWDRDRIAQVVTSLVANALKHGRGKPVEIELTFDGDAVLSVTDHGAGIDPSRRERVFDKFERAGLARDLGGLGLGLWMSRKIVEASGGKIDVRSELGRGSSFVVRLPAEASVPTGGT